MFNLNPISWRTHNTVHLYIQKTRAYADLNFKKHFMNFMNFETIVDILLWLIITMYIIFIIVFTVIVINCSLGHGLFWNKNKINKITKSKWFLIEQNVLYFDQLHNHKNVVFITIIFSTYRLPRIILLIVLVLK